MEADARGAPHEWEMIPIDDEPETEAERAAVVAALADFGLSMEEFQGMSRTPLDATP